MRFEGTCEYDSAKEESWVESARDNALGILIRDFWPGLMKQKDYPVSVTGWTEYDSGQVKVVLIGNEETGGEGCLFVMRGI